MTLGSEFNLFQVIFLSSEHEHPVFLSVNRSGGVILTSVQLSARSESQQDLEAATFGLSMKRSCADERKVRHFMLLLRFEGRAATNVCVCVSVCR